MINITEIEAEIKNAEMGETTMQNCSKLAVLYSVRDHLRKPYIGSVRSSSSEFMQAVQKAEIDTVFDVLDEHMQAIKAIYPKEYDAIIKRISI